MHHGIEYFPFKDGKYPVIFPNFQIFLHYDKSLRSKFDSRRESGLLLPQKKGHICLFMNSYHKFKTDVWASHASLKVDKHSIVYFARKYLPIFVLEHYLFHKAHGFCSSFALGSEQLMAADKIPSIPLDQKEAQLDHRWRQNVVRTKKRHTRRSRMSLMIYYCTDPRQLWIYLFIWLKRKMLLMVTSPLRLSSNRP